MAILKPAPNLPENHAINKIVGEFNTTTHDAYTVRLKKLEDIKGLLQTLLPTLQPAIRENLAQWSKEPGCGLEAQVGNCKYKIEHAKQPHQNDQFIKTRKLFQDTIHKSDDEKDPSLNNNKIC